MESGKKSNKILDIVRLQQIVKKWKKIAATNNTGGAGGGGSLETSTKFLKKTKTKKKSQSDTNGSIMDLGEVVPKGYLAVCVGRQEKEEGMQRFVIPTEYLGHQAFAFLLREAEEEFGFQQEGILKIPCDVPLFHNILKNMQKNVNVNVNSGSCCSYSPPPLAVADSEPQLNPSPLTY